MNVRFLSLGCGTQSTALFLMAVAGEIKIDFAVFADFGGDREATYDVLRRLERFGSPPVYRATTEDTLEDHLIGHTDGAVGTLRTVPVFFRDDTGKVRMMPRGCTSRYKIAPVDRFVRSYLGVAPKGPLPDGVEVTTLLGLSRDEPRRVAKARLRFAGRVRWSVECPLFDKGIDRSECAGVIAEVCPELRVPRSACVFCPFMALAEYEQMSPADRERAIRFDDGLRDPRSQMWRKFGRDHYVHRSCVPLRDVLSQAWFGDGPAPVVRGDCDGVCHT